MIQATVELKERLAALGDIDAWPAECHARQVAVLQNNSGWAKG